MQIQTDYDIDKIPTNWNLQTLEEIANLTAGGTPSRFKKEYWENGTIPWLSSGEVRNNVIKTSKEKITELGLRNSAAKLFPKGTVLIAITGQGLTRGRTALLEIDSTSNQSVVGIISKKDIVDNYYIWYSLQNQYWKLRSISQGSNQAGLNLDLLRSYKILIPSNIAEQQKIASILSNVDSLIQQTQKIIDQTQRLKKGLMQKLLTKGIGHTKFKKTKLGAIPVEWEIVKLREPTSKIGSGVTPLGGSQVYEKDGIPFIRSQNVRFDGLHLIDVAFISTKIHEEMKNTKLYPLDVLLNITGASIGRCTYVPEDFGDGNVNQHVCIIRTTEKLNPIFLTKYLSQDIMQNKINSAQAGLSRQGLTFKEIADFDVVLPPMAEQKKIVSIILNMDTHLNKKQKYKSNLENLKKGLMQKLLTGQIRVKI